MLFFCCHVSGRSCRWQVLQVMEGVAFRGREDSDSLRYYK
ncbi:hypothetical protein BRYFOR_08593 [Marvinbryantia formatexigens DSM 14469]|uniref:Uncharacterized protein n=1 Tax=Marvinbryantia formatexigens DSM 14469 TaxID=478749 RepID=C6LIW2_9FIRM|nr:hypothetical protein BRYFOR_08593 [Marvinbryantia formatexigens DSM 14469]